MNGFHLTRAVRARIGATSVLPPLSIVPPNGCSGP